MSAALKPKLAGVLPVFQTPYHEDESIDFATLEREIDWLYEQGSDGILERASRVDHGPHHRAWTDSDLFAAPGVRYTRSAHPTPCRQKVRGTL